MTLADTKALLIAIAGACAASIATALGVVQLASGQTAWLAEALASFVAAAVWMLVGLKLAPRSSAGAVLLFILGTAVMWFLSRGIVHSISPYYGLASLASAMAGAALVWTALGRNWRERVGSLIIPGVTFAIIALSVLARPTLGVTRSLSQADGEVRSVPVTHLDAATYLWTPTPLSTVGRVRVELDPGSGAGDYRLQEVEDSTTRSSVCDRFAADTRSLVASEVAGGHIPAFVTRLAFRAADCESGHVWALLP